jgi:hypothetical protein
VPVRPGYIGKRRRPTAVCRITAARRLLRPAIAAWESIVKWGICYCSDQTLLIFVVVRSCVEDSLGSCVVVDQWRSWISGDQTAIRLSRSGTSTQAVTYSAAGYRSPCLGGLLICRPRTRASRPSHAPPAAGSSDTAVAPPRSTITSDSHRQRRCWSPLWMSYSAPTRLLDCPSGAQGDGVSVVAVSSGPPPDDSAPRPSNPANLRHHHEYPHPYDVGTVRLSGPALSSALS